MNVNRISPVMVIARATGGLEKCFAEIAVTTVKVLLAPIIAGRPNIALDAIEIIAGVEIVDPVKLRFFAIPPGAIWQLMMTTVTHSVVCKRR